MTDQTELDFTDPPIESMTKFKPIVEHYIDVLSDDSVTYEKACAIDALTNLAEMLDGRYSPDIFPCVDVVQWGKVNRKEVIDYDYKHQRPYDR